MLPGPDEFDELAIGLNHMLDRLERGVAKRKEVVAPEPEAPEEEIPVAGSLEETLGVLRQLASRVG